MALHYIEHVVDDAAAAIGVMESVGWSFGGPQAELGGARLAERDGLLVAVRGKLSPEEQAVVRPYTRVADLEAAYAAALAAGGTDMLASMDIEGRGRIAIYGCQGLELGLWQPA